MHIFSICIFFPASWHKCKEQGLGFRVRLNKVQILAVLFPSRVTLGKLPKFSFLTYKVKIMITSSMGELDEMIVKFRALAVP